MSPAGAGSSARWWGPGLLGRALWLTSWWGGPLVVAAVLVGGVFAQAKPLVPLAVAVWLSYAVHELGHAAAALARGADRSRVRLVRHGAGLAVLAPESSGADTRLIALAGPVAGAASALAVVSVVGAAMALPWSALALPAAVTVLHHAVNLLPFAPDGRHVFGAGRRAPGARGARAGGPA
ncbi:MAG TPA: M50 family metallopeptidase [Humibacillus xanthopallidus]|nr:M50 family metallopeptidase [Humibacillus xanthopallidus]